MLLLYAWLCDLSTAGSDVPTSCAKNILCILCAQPYTNGQMVLQKARQTPVVLILHIHAMTLDSLACSETHI